MLVSDFQYDLPDELVADRPASPRDACRLLHLDRRTGAFADRRFTDIGAALRSGDLLVLNDTRVIPARLYGRKATGGRIEILLERVPGPRVMVARVRAGKAPLPGSVIRVGDDGAVALEVTGREGEFFHLSVPEGCRVADLLECHGHMPIPPYMGRDDDERDRVDYQTVFARQPGAVAAPTAGLHFSEPLLAALQDSGVEVGFLTLHVGAGTFQPVRCAAVPDHVMHSEWFDVPEALCRQVRDTHRRGGRIIAVGTTSVRGLEAAAGNSGISTGAGETDIFIYPGYRFRVVDAMITNFHLPESTLLMLVSAFAGRENVLRAYRHAVAERYRFFSYGDAMLID